MIHNLKEAILISEKDEEATTEEGQEAEKQESGVLPYTVEELKHQEHEQRVGHNRRTGGGEVREGELDEQREEHNRRTGGS